MASLQRGPFLNGAIERFSRKSNTRMDSNPRLVVESVTPPAFRNGIRRDRSGLCEGPQMRLQVVGGRPRAFSGQPAPATGLDQPAHLSGSEIAHRSVPSRVVPLVATSPPMPQPNHDLRFEGNPKTKLQAFGVSRPTSFQSQMPPPPENRLPLNGLRDFSRPTNECRSSNASLPAPMTAREIAEV